MTSRRASGIVRRARSRAGPLTGIRSAALVAAGLLLAATAAQAATHSTHAHHAPVQSSGKAEAHVLHEAAPHTSHKPERATSHRPERVSARRSRSLGHPGQGSRVAVFSRKGDRGSPHSPGSPGSKHLRPGHGASRATANARNGHRSRSPEPVDEPVPVYRSRDDRRPHPPLVQWAGSRPTREAHTSEQAPGSFTASRSSATGIAGNVARNTARRNHGGHPAEASGGLSPDGEEGLPGTGPAADRNAAPGPPRRSRPLAFVPPAGRAAASPTALLTAPPPIPPPVTEVVEGFGDEVDFHTPAGVPGRPTPAAYRAALAQGERDLREAAEVASNPMFVPLVTREGKLLVPPPLRGSRDILVHQNQMADDAGLSRIQDDADLARMRRARLLVDFPESGSLRMNDNLPENRRCARPWTVQFAIDIAQAFYRRFGEALQVNSAVRTVAYQVRLQRVNGNAARTEGELASPHLTGQALDFGKRGMSVAEIAWMRSYLMPLMDSGKIDVEEEFQQACFHISVYSSYSPALRKHSPARTEVAQITRSAHPRATALTEPSDDDMH